MELELGLKITKTRDDITSISEYGLAKDRAGPVFQSRETNTMFILTAHLKGYKSSNIVIKINEDGSKISISGEKPIQEMLMVGCVMLKKEVEITGFSKVFKIPDGVILDRIKAKYDEEEFGVILKIVMPKLVKGICGAKIEEVKEEEHVRGRSEIEKSEADQILKSVGETSQKGSKDSEVQQMEDRESVMGKKEGGLYEKMFDDANGDIVGETIKSEMEESKLGIEEDRNGESVRDKVGQEEHVPMKTPELEQNVGTSIPKNIGAACQDEDFKVQEMEDRESVMGKKEGGLYEKMLDDANGDIVGDTIKSKIEEPKWGIEDRNGESVRNKVGQEEYVAMQTPEPEQNVGTSIPNNIGATSQDEDFKVQEMEDSGSVVKKKETVASDKILDDANGKIIEETSQKEIEESKLEIKDGNGESVSQKVGTEGYEVMKKSELEQTVGASIPQKIGDTSQNKESKVQKRKDSESVLEKKEGGISDKKLDGANREIIGETIQKEVEEPEFGIEDRNGEKKKEKVGKEGYEVMKTSEVDQNVGMRISEKIGDTSQDKEAGVHKMEDNVSVEKESGVSDKMLGDVKGNIIGDTIQKNIEGSKLGIEDGMVESVKEKVGKAAYEAVKKSEIEQNVGTCIPQNIGDTSQDKESEVLQMEDKGSIVEKEKMVTNKMLDGASRNIREMIQKDIEESKLGIEDGDGESVREKDRKVGCKARKTSELDQNVADYTPSNTGGTSQKESEIQQMEKTGNVEGKMDGGEPKRMLIEAIPKNIFEEIISKDIEKPKIGIENGDQEYVREKAGKEGFEAMMTVREEFPKQLPKATLKESEGLNGLKMQETKDVKEAMVKRKGKEIEYFVEKGEGEEPKRMHVETKRLIEKDINKKTRQEEIEKPKSGTMDSDHQNVQKNTVKGGFEVSNRITEELPKQVGEELHDGGKGFKVAKVEEPKEVVTKEAMADTETLLEKVKGEESKKRTEEASRVIEKSTVTENLQKETEESYIERKAGDVPNVSSNIVKGVLGTAQEKIPKQVVETLEGMAQDENDKIEYGIVKLKGEGSIKKHEVLEEDTTGDGIEKEIREPKLISSDQLSGQQDVDDGGFDGSERPKFPEMEETKDAKDGAKIEQPVKKVNREKIDKKVEANGGFRKYITRETTWKETEGPKVQTKEKDQQRFKQEMSKGRFEASNAAKEEFPMKMVDSLANKREGLKDTKIEEAKEVKEELIKPKSWKRMEETEDVKDELAEIEQFAKKVKGEQYEKIQLEENGGLMKDITRETTQKETKEPKIQCLQEEMSKGIFEASTTAREFLLPIEEDLLAKKRKRPKDQEIEEAEEVDKRKFDETKFVESPIKEKIQSENERITQSLQGVPEEKHPKSLETGTPERELESAEGPTACEEVASMGFKEVEQGNAKDKTQKSVLLPSKNQSKEARESKGDSVKQGILKPNKAKEVGEGEKCNYNIESTKEAASIEDEVAKPLSEPRFPSAQKSEVDQKGKLYEGSKAEYKASLESQKEDPTKDLQNSIEKKDSQESKQMVTLKPEIPLEEHLKERVQVNRQDEFYKGQEDKKTMQEKTEEPKNKIDDRDQQNVQRDVGKGVVTVETTEKKMPKEEYVADVGPISGRKETKRDLEATFEREKYITTQNVNDEKPKARVMDGLRKADIANVDKAKCIAESQEKGHPRKSEVVEKEAEPMEAISSLPSVTSIGFKEVGPKNGITEVPRKELSPITVEMKSKESLNSEKQMMDWKFLQTKEYIPESTDREQYGYNTEDLKEPKLAAYQRGKPSNLPSPIENVVQEHEASKESPNKNTNIGLQESNERMATIENEELETLQPHILESQCLAERQKIDGKEEEEAGECGFQDIYGKETKAPKILIVEENNDKKEYQMTKDVEDELSKPEHKAEIVFEKREGRKDAKSEETKEASKQLSKRERGEITQTAEVKKPKMKDITPEFEQVAEKMHETQRESEKVTSIDEENRKLENVIEEHDASKKSPKKNTNIDLQESNERMATIENEELETLQPHILESQCLAERQNVDGREEEAGECGLQDVYEEETKAPKILVVEGNNDKKGYQMTKDVEDELLKQEHKAEIDFEKRAGPNVANTEETKEASKQLPKRERVEITQTAEVKKPKMKDITPEFEQVAEKMHETQRESEKVTSKMGIEITPNKGIEKSQTEVISPLPMEIQSKEHHELSWPNMEHEIPKIEGMTELQVVTDKVTKPSKVSSSSSTQPFEDKEKYKIAASHDPIESPQLESSPTDQQCINKDQEESHGMYQIEEENANEQDSQVLEEPKEEASGGEKDGTKRSNKLLVPFVMAGSALLVSLIVIFVRHRRARKSMK